MNPLLSEQSRSESQKHLESLCRSFCPHVPVLVRIDQLNRYTKSVSFLSHAPLQNRSNTQLFGNFPYRLGCFLVGHHGSSRNDFNLTLETVEIISSVIPSAKYSSCGSGLMFVNGSTAILRTSKRAEARIASFSQGMTILKTSIWSVTFFRDFSPRLVSWRSILLWTWSYT